MNENAKTIFFVAVAVVVSLGVWINRPRLRVLTSDKALPAVLFAGFDDPLSSASLEIVQFNESTATLRPFKVAQVDDKWSIPSHENYPADAENQLAEVAAGLVGLEPLDMASDSPGDHELYGVVDPDPQKLKPGDTGVGTRVEIRSQADEVLLSLVIGKEVPDRSELRYVRVPGRDPVYTVKLKNDKLSTKFEDWIEKDLLKLNTMDVKGVEIYDYSVDVLAGRQVPRNRMTLQYNDSDSKWNLTEAKVFRDGDWVAEEMAEDEELDTSKLNSLKWELDDLKIVDVARKPEGLSENLRDTGQVKTDAEGFQSLMDRGFYIVRLQDHFELLSSEGEISVSTKDGVRYVLRFGQMAGGGEEEADTEEEKKEEEEGEKSDEGGVNRYLFVMAEFNPEAIVKPELEPLPGKEETAGGEGSAGEVSEAKASDAGTSEEKQAEGEKETSEDAASKDAAADSKEEKSDAEKERERIAKENKRKQEEYDEKIKKGKEHVDELNARFADWYYVISNEVYRKIHLSRDDVVKKKEKKEEDKEAEAAEAGQEKAAADQGSQPKEEGGTPADFEKIKKDGLEGGEG